jgi:chemotaxis protein CheX
MEAEIIQYTKEVWQSILEIEVETTDVFKSSEIEKTLLGFIQITGAWNGTISIHCSASVARRAASVMFGIEEVSASMEEIQDALGELTNMVGGNIKGLLPEHQQCQLSLPACAITDHQLYVSDSVEVAKVVFCYNDQSFVVSVQKRS